VTDRGAWRRAAPRHSFRAAPRGCELARPARPPAPCGVRDPGFRVGDVWVGFWFPPACTNAHVHIERGGTQLVMAGPP
jgi:hypothetical protein